MMWKNVYHCLVLVVCIIVCTGCAQTHYKDDQLRKVDGVVFGTVVNVSRVQGHQEPDMVVPLAGTAAGGVVGAVVGGSAPAAAIGAAVGLVASGGAQMQGTTFQATELTVELESGRYLLIIIGTDEYFVRGDEVRIMGMGEHYVRVQHK